MNMSRLLAVLAALMLSVMWTAPASAQASRTWISGVGDDANPCSRTAPCKTFAGAISKTAAGGEIDCLDPGGFGAVTITKAITLDCGGGIGGQVGSVLVSGTNGIVVAAGASDKVKLRNLSVNGLGTGLSGIKFLTGLALIIEHVGVWGFTTAGVDFEPGAGSKLFMLDVETQFNPGSGVLVAPGSGGGAGGLLDRVTAMSNGDSGLKVNVGSGAANMVVVDSAFTGNTNFGIDLIAPTTVSSVMATNSAVTNNSTGVQSDGANATIRIGNMTISRNGTGVSAANSSSLLSFGDNDIAGNVSDGSPTGAVIGKK